MKIIETNVNRYSGNDCMISKDVSLVEVNNNYVVIESTSYSGYFGYDENINIHKDNYSLEEARKIYNDLLKE